MDINKLKTNTKNPRKISMYKFGKLKKSLEEFPEMMKLRPIVYRSDTMEVLGGNMRLRALKELGYKEIPDEWVVDAVGLSEEKVKEFIIKDNLNYGDWDWDLLANFYEKDVLEDWGLDVNWDEDIAVDFTEDELEGYEKIASEWTERMDYVILTFDNEVDFQNFVETFNLRRKNKKGKTIGVGKVMKGAEVLKKLNGYG